MKAVLASAVIVTALGGPAFAACQYNGVYYQAGAQLCFDGWLQECTVADYWKAIGMCKVPDAIEPLTDSSRVDRDILIAEAPATREDPVSRPVATR